MSQELMGLEYLKKKEIKNMKCDMNKPFAFISYSHDEYDSQIVMNVFKKLMERGHNLWIDIANMPADEHTWKKAAIDALTNKNCKFAFFFRSESSMIKKTIGNLENGRYNSSLKLSMDIAKVFNTTVEDIFTFEDYKRVQHTYRLP